MSEISLSRNLSRDRTREVWLSLANAASALQKAAQLMLGEEVSCPVNSTPTLSITPLPSSHTVAEAINDFLVAKARAGKSDRYVRTLRNSLSKFARGRSRALMDSVTVEQLEIWLAESGWAAGTQEGYLSDVSILYNYGKKRGWCASNPASMVELPDVEEGPVAVHSPEQVRIVMDAARELDLDVMRCMALRYFGGLRAIEAECQVESDIQREEKFLKVTRAKKRTRARRPVTISAVLDAWLGVGGSLPLQNAGQKMAALVKAVEAKGVSWPQNAPRHSFCSYHLAWHENAALTAKQAGHSETILYQRYNGEVTKRDAEKFWQIYPTT